MDQYKDMLENKFCSIIAPSASTGPPHFTMCWSKKAGAKNKHQCAPVRVHRPKISTAGAKK